MIIILSDFNFIKLNIFCSQQVKFEKLEGRNFLNKMEFLMAALTKIKE